MFCSLYFGIPPHCLPSGDSYSVSSYGEEGKWSDDGEMTWVKDLLPECFHDAETSMKVDHLQARTSLLNISICNLSSLGATAEDDLHNQLGRFFAVFPPKKTPESKPALDPATTCYSTSYPMRVLLLFPFALL